MAKLNPPSTTADTAPDETNPQARIEALQDEVERQKKRAQAAETDARALRELSEHIREVFWMTNALGDELIFISPAYEAIWGQTCNSLFEDPGRRLAWVHDADRERVLKAFKRDARHGRYDETFRISRPDGQTRWIRDRAWPVYDDDGQVYRLAGFANDLTDEVANWDRVTELGDALTVRERLSVLATVGASMAHELGQPLTAARNHLARIRRAFAGDNKELAKTADQIDAELERANATVRHMRDFVRRGRPTLHWHALDDLLGDVHDLSGAGLRREDICYRTEVAPCAQGMRVAVDRILFQQILRNLIQNAIEALIESDTPAGERLIIVSAGLDDRNQVEISVADNGEGLEGGISPFSAFQSTRLDGLGLGLHVSRSLARGHGGELHVAEASPPMQTRFVLHLPRSARDSAGRPHGDDISAVVA